MQRGKKIENGNEEKKNCKHRINCVFGILRNCSAQEASKNRKKKTSGRKDWEYVVECIFRNFSYSVSEKIVL